MEEGEKEKDMEWRDRENTRRMNWILLVCKICLLKKCYKSGRRYYKMF